MEWEFIITCSNDTTALTLTDEPMDFLDYTITIRRDPKTHGKMIDMANSLTFFGDAYGFIKSKYDTFGVEADLVLSITVTCDGTTDILPDARFNMSSLEFNEGSDCTVTCDLEDASCIMKFKNRQDLKVDLLSLNTVDDPDGATLTAYDNIGVETAIPAKSIQKIDEIYYTSDQGVSSVSKSYTHTTDGPVPLSIFFWMAQSERITELSGLNGDYVSGGVVDTIDSDVPYFWTHPVISNQYGSITVTGLFHVTLYIEVGLTNVTLNGGSGAETFKDVTATTVLKITHPDLSDDYVTLGTNSYPGYWDNTFAKEISIPLSFDANLQVGDLYTIYIHVEIDPAYTIINPMNPVSIEFFETVTDFHDSYTKFDVLTSFPSTQAKLSLVNETLSRITEKLTGDCLRMYSSYFGSPTSEPYDRENPDVDNGVACNDFAGECYGCGHGFSITNGLLLRRIEDAACFISFRELYDSLNAIFCIGMGIEDDPFRSGYQRLRIEKAEFFYEDTPMSYGINYPDKIIRTIKTDLFFSNLVVGYQNWESEAFSSLDDFFSQRQYTSPITQIGGDKSLISSVIASNYAAELTRQQKENTANWKYDNSIFIFEGNRTADTPGVLTGECEEGSDVIDPDTVYNTEISPFVMALRWFKFLFAIFKDNLAVESVLNFVSGTGNYAAIIQRNPAIDECQLYTDGYYPEDENLTYDILLDEEDNPPFLGFEQWDFTYPMSFANYQEVRNNFYQQIPVTYNSSGTKYAYLMEVSYKPAQGLATFRAVKKWDNADTQYILAEDGTFILQEDGSYIIWEP